MVLFNVYNYFSKINPLVTRRHIYASIVMACISDLRSKKKQNYSILYVLKTLRLSLKIW